MVSIFVIDLDSSSGNFSFQVNYGHVGPLRISQIQIETIIIIRRALFVHGFAVDEKHDKMSKSVGNVVNPEDITKGGNDKKKNPIYGVDTLRYSIENVLLKFNCD